MTTWPSVAFGTGWSVTTARFSRPPCWRSTSAFIVLTTPVPPSRYLPDLHHPVHVRPDALALDAVDVDGNRRPGAGITQPVDLVKPRMGVAAITGQAEVRARGLRRGAFAVPVVERFLQGVLVDRIGAPGVVRMDRAELAATPHDRDDGE